AAYIALDIYLTRALGASLLRRGRQVEQLLAQQIRHNNVEGLGVEIESRYAPTVNDRFVRVSTPDGKILFESATPPSLKFSPGSFPPPIMPPQRETTSKLTPGTGSQVLVARHVAEMPGNGRYLIETGAPLDEVQADLRQWLIILAAGLPLLVIVSVIGGY